MKSYDVEEAPSAVKEPTADVEKTYLFYKKSQVAANFKSTQLTHQYTS